MTGLGELQAAFTAAIFDTGRMPPGDVTSHTAAVPIRRFNVYRNNVFSSLIDVLEAYFPVVVRLVGKEFFRAMARAFIVASPPRSPILSQYGMGFPDFIASFEPAADTPYLGDVARLELMRQRAYHARDHAPLLAQDIAAIAPERIGDVVFALHPSAALMISPYPVVSIWRTNTFDDDVRRIDISCGSESALVVRPELTVMVVPLPTPSAAFVRQIMQGCTIREALEKSEHLAPGLQLTGTIATLIEVGAIAGFDVGGTSAGQIEARSTP